MSGGTMFEASNNAHLGHGHAHAVSHAHAGGQGHGHGHHAEGMMSDWTPLRREKDMFNDRPVPSPTYSHVSTHDSTASPYALPQPPLHPSSASYHPHAHSHPSSHPAQHHTPHAPPPHHAYPLGPSPTPGPPASQPRYNHQPQYNSSGEYDVFQTPTAHPRGRMTPGFEYPQPIIYDPSVAANGGGGGAGGLLTTSTLSRSYDSTIPQYYPVMVDRSWTQTPDKAGQKRKRAKGSEMGTPTPTPTPAAAASMAASKARSGKKKAVNASADPVSSPELARANKRVRTETATSISSAHSHLPTPPATGHFDPAEAPTPTFSVRTVETSVVPDVPTIQHENASEGASTAEIGAAAKKKKVRVTKSEEGRKLAVGQPGEEDELVVVEEKPLRSTPVPALITSASGRAAVSTNPILESELAWLQNGGRAASTSASSPDRNVVTPLPDILADEEEEDKLDAKGEKTAKRLQAFNLSSVVKVEEPMVCTRISTMGRVAVRKDAAMRFLGLDTSSESATTVIEETKEDEAWVPSPIAGSSRLAIKPSWPDQLAPWSIATGVRGKKEREERERTTLLRRYLENSADEASDDDEVTYPVQLQGKGKGKSVARLVHVSAPDAADPRRTVRGPWENTNADAKAALLTALRSRALPVVPPGIMACVCGTLAAGLGNMLSCANCKTWHHALCNGVSEAAIVNGGWWCPTCESSIVRLGTPHQTPRHAYIQQSEERSSAFKGNIEHIALAPSPMFVSSATFSQAPMPLRTPLNRVQASPTSRNHRSRILSYGTDIWATGDEALPLPTPSTPAPEANRFTTPRIDDAPFDVTSTPSRHLDFGFGVGQPGLFSLTPLVGRNRMPSMMMNDTPLTYRTRMASQSDLHGQSASGSGAGPVGGRHDFLRDLAGPSSSHGGSQAPASPSSTKFPHALLGAHSISSSGLGMGMGMGLGHKRNMSGSKLSSMRSGSRSGLGLGLPIGSTTSSGAGAGGSGGRRGSMEESPEEDA